MNWIFLQTLRGSFSAVSTPIFASKYSLESSWRDLQDLHTFAPLRSQNFSQKSSTFFREWKMNFRFFFIFCVKFCYFFCEFFMKLCPDFATNSRKEWRVSLFQSNLRKQIRKLPKILKSVKSIHYYWLLCIRVLTPWVTSKQLRLDVRGRGKDGPHAADGALLRGDPERGAPKERIEKWNWMNWMINT